VLDFRSLIVDETPDALIVTSPADEKLAYDAGADVYMTKPAEGQLAAQFRRLAALREIDIAIASSSDLRLTLNILLEQVVSLLQVDALAHIREQAGAHFEPRLVVVFLELLERQEGKMDG